MSDKFDFSLDLPKETKRTAYRSYVPGLMIYVCDREKSYPIKDLSATGVAFYTESDSFAKDSSFFVDLHLSNKPFVEGLKAQVVRVEEGKLAACIFHEMNRRQEARLDKLVLEVQKRLITIKKARNDAEKA